MPRTKWPSREDEETTRRKTMGLEEGEEEEEQQQAFKITSIKPFGHDREEKAT